MNRPLTVQGRILDQKSAAPRHGVTGVLDPKFQFQAGQGGVSPPPLTADPENVVKSTLGNVKTIILKLKYHFHFWHVFLTIFRICIDLGSRLGSILASCCIIVACLFQASFWHHLFY